MKEKFCFVIAVMTVITCILTACVGEEQTSLILNNTSITMKIGEVLSLQAKSTDGKSEKELQWSSDNSSVVEVSSNGEIKAISKGKAKVSVMNSEGVQARCDVTVENVEIESIQLNCLKKSISVNKSVSLNAKIYPDNATDGEVQWLSEDSDIADVNSNGLVTGKKAGTVNIICRSNNGKQASCTIVVKKKKVKKIVLNRKYR